LSAPIKYGTWELADHRVGKYNHEMCTVNVLF